MKRILLIGLAVLSLISMTACNKTEREVIVADKSSDYYFYNICVGKSVYVVNYSLNQNDCLKKIDNDMYNVDCTKFSSLIDENDNSIDSSLFQVDYRSIMHLTITCLKPFEGTIHIKYFEYNIANDFLVKIRTNIDLIYDSNCEVQPALPRGYKSPFDLGMSKPSHDIIGGFRKKTYYIYFNPVVLKLRKVNYEYRVIDMNPNSDMVTLSKIEWAIAADIFNYNSDYLELEYTEIDTEMNVTDYVTGVVLKLDFEIDTSNDISIGFDLVFQIRCNGDYYYCPYTLFYTNCI